MGYGNYAYEAHEAIVKNRASASVQEVFRQRTCHPLMNPKGVLRAKAGTAPAIRTRSRLFSRWT